MSRISNNQIFEQSISSILSAQVRVSEAQERVNTNRAIVNPSDDPVGAALTIRLTEELNQLNQFQRNNDLLTNSLEQEEAVLRSINDAVTRARQLAIQAGNGALGTADRAAIGLEIETIRDQVFDLFNSQDADGNFIFSGSQSQSPAFRFDPTASGNVYQFQGDQTVSRIQVSENVFLDSGDSGKVIFEDVLARLNANLGASTAASASLSVSDQGTFDQFFLANYDAVTAANNNFRLTVNGAGNQIAVTNVGTGAALGTFNFSSGSPFVFNGVEFNLNAAAGDTVDFSLNPPQKKNFAETLNDFAAVLGNQNISAGAYEQALNDVLVGLDNGLETLANATSGIGGRLNVAQSVLASNQDLVISNEEARRDIREVDTAEAISDLAQQTSALEAAQATFTRVTQLSLFDFL